MGLSDRQLYIMVACIIAVMLYPLLPSWIAREYGLVYGWIAMVIPFVVLVVVLIYRIAEDRHEDRKE